jgi:hypothetical protein
VAAAFVAALASAVACVNVDAGPDFGVTAPAFSADYYYCQIEPQLIVGKGCGDDGTHACHYASAGAGMPLVAHAAIACDKKGHVTDPTSVAQGGAAAANYASVSAQMDSDYLLAPLCVWPTQQVAAHPDKVFGATDPVVQTLAAWAQQ